MIKSRESWYRSNSFWGSIATTGAVILSVAAFLETDLRWLLIVAWLFGCVAVWSLVRSVFATGGEVRLAAIMGSLMLGLALLYLHSFMQPGGDLPSAESKPACGSGTPWFQHLAMVHPRSTFSFTTRVNFRRPTWATYYTLATAARILSEKEVTDIQDRALGFLKLGQPREQIDPGLANDPFFTIPENAGEQRTSDILSRDLDHVLDGSRLMYLVVDFSYRDLTTPSDAYRISESCVYFTRTLQSGQACGRKGTSLEKMDTSSAR